MLLYLLIITLFLIVDIVMIIYLLSRNALNIKLVIYTTLIFALIGIPIDIFVTHLELWIFNPKWMVGWWLFGLPFEEYLFFLFIMPFIVLLFRIVKYRIIERKRKSSSRNK